MSDQHHHNQQQHNPYEPYAPYEPYGAPEAYAPHTDGGQPPAQASYDYGYEPYQPHAPQQPQTPAAWPQHDYPADPDPQTQTWQTQTWDTQTWQQPLAPSAEARTPQAAAVPPVDSADWDAGWQQNSGQGAPSWAQQPQEAYEPVAAPLPVAVSEVVSAPEPVAAEVPAAQPMTAAEKAKAEGRPQILSPGLRPALVTAVLAVLLAVAAPVARPVLAVPVLLLQAVTAAGWFRLNGMWPARQGIALAFLGGVVADAGLLVTDTAKAPTVLLGTLGVWLLLVIVLQLRSNASPDERLYGLTSATASTALTVVAAGHLASDSDAVVVGALSVAAAALARALPLPSFAAPIVALAAAAGAGVAGGQLTGLGPSAALLGLAAGVCALIGLRVASYDYPSRFVHMTAGVALPLTLAAPAVYVLGRVLG